MKRSVPPSRAVILAAGRGRRLVPYTDFTPKPLLRVNGRPLLDCTLCALSRAGVTDVCLVTHHLSSLIKAYVGNGTTWDLKINYVHQPELLGTAHALQAAAGFISEPCFVLAADYVLAEDYLIDLRDAYCQGEAELAVSLKQLLPSELSSRSSVRFDTAGQIVEIVEKPEPGTAPSQYGASLIYIVPPAIREYLAQLTLSRRQEYELPTVINRMLADGYHILGLIQCAPAEWLPT